MKEIIKSLNLDNFFTLFPESLFPIIITFALSFLIGFEREEKRARQPTYNFGGIRTFPIIGISGYLTAQLSVGNPLLLSVGLLVLGSLLWLSYRNKLKLYPTAGITSEISGLFTFLLGALIFHRAMWEAAAVSIVVLMLLELKTVLEKLAHKIPSGEIITLTRFLLISAVILPVVPNQAFGAFHFNPFTTWLVVVAISGLSYAAYVVGKIFGAQKGVLIGALLGGLYSSTGTTIVLAKRSHQREPSHLISGGIIIASGIMYFRLIVFLIIFNAHLASKLWLSLLILGLIFCGLGASFMAFGRARRNHSHVLPLENKNPLELGSAFGFALLFALMSGLSMLVINYLGSMGMYALAFLSGLADVDAFVMSLTQNAGTLVAESIAVQGVIIATASNNLMKGLYAAIWGFGDVRKQASSALISLAILSISALFFL